MTKRCEYCQSLVIENEDYCEELPYFCNNCDEGLSEEEVFEDE